MNRLFAPRKHKTAPSKLQPLTLRGFGGGWNTIDDDISMKPQFLVALNNFRRTSSGGQELRFGSKWYADVKGAVTGVIVDMQYFSGFIVVVMSTGQIAKVSQTGVVTAIWNTAIAAALPGAPGSWGSTFAMVNFVPFKDQLIIHNGVDKPVSIDKNLVVTYLQDLATGSNVNVPIGLYGCVASNYHCIMGIPAAPTTVYISSVGTSGVFPGDPLPNDSISIDVGAYAPSGGATIRGCTGFRQFLIIFFEKQSLLITLGVYNATGVHTPQFPDSLPQAGLLGHRCITLVDNDVRFASARGLGTGSRNLYTVTIDTKYLSNRVESGYRSNVGSLTDTQQLVNSFIVYDELTHDTLLFSPQGTALVFTKNTQLEYEGWSYYTGLNWTCGCSSFLGRVFFASGTRIYQHGNPTYAGENYTADKLLDRDATWAPNTNYSVSFVAYDNITNESYTCATTHSSGMGTFLQDRTNNPTLWTLYTGVAINFEFELPWLDSQDPMKVKHMYFASAATKGTAEFTLELYVDNLYKDVDGNKIYNAAISMNFVGNDAPGFGFDAGPLGGGRRSRDPRLWGTPVKFKTIKPRIFGSTKKPLQLVNLSFLFARGRYKR